MSLLSYSQKLSHRRFVPEIFQRSLFRQDDAVRGLQRGSWISRHHLETEEIEQIGVGGHDAVFREKFILVADHRGRHVAKPRRGGNLGYIARKLGGERRGRAGTDTLAILRLKIPVHPIDSVC